MMRRCLTGLAGCLTVLLVAGGCGADDSYDAVEAGLRDWLAAASAGDATVCQLEAPGSDFREELLQQYPELGGPGTSCAERAARMNQIGLPPPDSTLDVPVWDPSGEALVEATTPDGEIRKFWMLYDEGRWLVSGEAT